MQHIGEISYGTCYHILYCREETVAVCRDETGWRLGSARAIVRYLEPSTCDPCVRYGRVESVKRTAVRLNNFFFPLLLLSPVGRSRRLSSACITLARTSANFGRGVWLGRGPRFGLVAPLVRYICDLSKSEN